MKVCAVKIGFFLFFLALTRYSFAQEYLPPERLLEEIESEDIGITDFSQILQELLEHPINLNRASSNDLLKIPFLTPDLAIAIVRYRRSHGKFENPQQLLLVEGVSPELLNAIIPYLKVEKESHFQPSVDYRVRLQRRFNTIRGFEQGVYQNPFYLYQKIFWNPGENTRIGFLSEKDAGESEWSDLSSLYFQTHLQSLHSTFLVGDYQIKSGGGLVFHEPYGMPVTVGTELPFRQNGVQWHHKTSVDENTFFRGFLWNLSPSSPFSFLVAYSRNHIDVNLADSSHTITSFVSSGYHRSETERSKKDLSEESIFTIYGEQLFSGGRVGVQYADFKYNHPVKVGAVPYLENHFRYISLSHSFQRGAWRWQGEAAFLNFHYPAIQHSLFFHSRERPFSYGMVFFYEHPRFWSRYGREVGSVSDETGNKIGLLLNVNARVDQSLILSFMVHTRKDLESYSQFLFPKNKYILQLDYSPGRTGVVLRYSTQTQRRTSGFEPYREERQRKVRAQIQTFFSPRLRFIQRVELSWANTVTEQRNLGFLMYFDVFYRLPNNGGKVQIRWTHFDVPDYSLRLYEFENDLPGSFRNVLLNGRGYKWFVLTSLFPFNSCRLTLKYQEIWYPDKTLLGSGLNEILENRKRTLSLELHFKL
ncbi:MAG: helix-hairpin-helix domain-containing protein [Calditrichaeota bacterium]|nr:MAG: helix-hairpin-helix domain-containing protein [Calditrichota bacterium]